MSVNSFRDLRVWQAGMELVERVYALTQEMPPHELYSLTNQMRRAAVSIPSNIAEGHTREHTKEYLHHLSIAQASLAELQTQLELAKRLTFLPDEKVAVLLNETTSLAKQLYALRNAINRRLQTPTPNSQPL